MVMTMVTLMLVMMGFLMLIMIVMKMIIMMVMMVMLEAPRALCCHFQVSLSFRVSLRVYTYMYVQTSLDPSYHHSLFCFWGCLTPMSDSLFAIASHYPPYICLWSLVLTMLYTNGVLLMRMILVVMMMLMTPMMVMMRLPMMIMLMIMSMMRMIMLMMMMVMMKMVMVLMMMPTILTRSMTMMMLLSSFWHRVCGHYTKVG